MISAPNIRMAHELFYVRAYCFSYSSLLEDFRKTVKFVRATRNPAMDALDEADCQYSTELMERECYSLMSEIDRLEMDRRTHDKRLKNAMNLVYIISAMMSVNFLKISYHQVLSTFGVGDSQRMQQMTEAAVRDSAGMLFIY